MKKILCAVLAAASLVCMADAVRSPKDAVMARLREVANSKSYYWAWTHPWLEVWGKDGDATFAVQGSDGTFRPKRTDDVRLSSGYQKYAGGERPLIAYSDLAALAGTWHSERYYAVNRATMTAAIRRYWRELGGLMVFSWHMDQPYCTNGFPQASYRYKSTGDDRNVIRQILDGTGGPCGTDTLERKNARPPCANPREWYMRRIGEIADFVNGLVDEETGERIPVIIRHAHECDGNWFWWGRTWCSADEYRRFSRLTADLLRERCGADRLIFAYTPDRTWTEFGQEGDSENTFLAYYPGDRYVDILGLDDYSIGQGDDAKAEASFKETLRKLRLMSDFAAARGQVAAISETGGTKKRDDFWRYVHRLMTADGVNLAFVDTWSGCYGMIPDTPASEKDEIAFAARRETLLEGSGLGFGGGPVWRLGKGVTREGDILTVVAPKGGSAAALAGIDLSRFAGKGFRASIRARGEGIEKPRANWLGFKFMLSYRDGVDGGQVWPAAGGRSGDFDWRLFSFSTDISAKPGKGELTLGLQEAGGKVQFDLSTLRIECRRPLFEPDAGTEKCVYDERVRAYGQLRGVMLPGGPCKEDDFRTLHAWGATLARYQMSRGWGQTRDNQDVGEYLAWVDGKLDHLERDVLPWAAKYGIKIVVDLHVAPGGRTEGGDMLMFYEPKYAEAFEAAWRRIATRFRGRPEIYGFDLINEPDQKEVALEDGDWIGLQRRVAKIVREIDPVTPIVIESNGWDGPSTYSYMKALDLTNVIYQVHMYLPMEFTHQGVHAKDGNYRRVAYPNDRHDREFLRRKLQPVRDFELRHGAKIYVGEFSAIAWAEGADRYIRDCISIFREYGWDWTYHAFREWDGWSVEHEGPDAGHMKRVAETPRMKALKDGFAAPRIP